MHDDVGKNKKWANFKKINEVLQQVNSKDNK